MSVWQQTADTKQVLAATLRLYAQATEAREHIEQIALRRESLRHAQLQEEHKQSTAAMQERIDQLEGELNQLRAQQERITELTALLHDAEQAHLEDRAVNLDTLKRLRATIDELCEKCGRKRLRLHDMKEALQDATNTIASLREQNKEGNVREMALVPMYKRAKFLQEFCEGPGSDDSLGKTEYHVKELATTFVIELGPGDCTRPTHSMGLGSFKNHADLATALCYALAPGILLQYHSARKWRDCFLAGKAGPPLTPTTRTSECVSVRRVQNYDYEGTSTETNVHVSHLRFADFVDGEAFFAQFTK
jgi:hypothetical protein